MQEWVCPFGGVLACKDAVIPNAVGVDIGCGMCAVKSNYKVTDISPDVLRKKIMSGIRQRIPLRHDASYGTPNPNVTYRRGMRQPAWRW